MTDQHVLGFLSIKREPGGYFSLVLDMRSAIIKSHSVYNLSDLGSALTDLWKKTTEYIFKCGTESLPALDNGALELTEDEIVKTVPPKLPPKD